MNFLKTHKVKIITGFTFALVTLVTPLIAQVSLNTFQPDTTISSSQMNENFSNLNQALNEMQSALDSQCEQPGQLIFNGIIDEDGNTVSSFTCEGITVTTSRSQAGAYDVHLTGIDPDDAVLQVTARPGFLGFRSCNSQLVDIGDPFFRINCANESNVRSDTPINLTIFRIQ